jgi:restriction endonuclease Mrr
MSSVSERQVFIWVLNSINSQEWQRLSDFCTEVLTEQLPSKSETEIADLVDEHLNYVEESMRNNIAQVREDGEIQLYEVDDESPPFVRATKHGTEDLLRGLSSMKPDNFEKVCAVILRALGAESEKTGGSHDGGVDFLGYNFSTVRHGISVPIASRAIVIGQAKRYKRSHVVRETELRKFIGGAIKIADELRSRPDFGVLSPVLYAFWTTSDFDINAKKFARKMGLWFMNGPTLASYIKQLGIDVEIRELINEIQGGNH